MKNYLLLDLLYIFVSLFTAAAGIIYYRLQDRPAKFLTWYFITVAIISPILTYLAYHGKNSIRLYHFYDPIEYFYLVFAFSYWTGNAKLTKILRYSIFGFLLLSAANSLRMPDINHYNYAALTIAHLIYVFISTWAIFYLVRGDRGNLAANPVFWLAISLFVMSADNSLWYAINEYLPFDKYWILLLNVHKVIDIISFLLSAVGFFLYRYPECAERASEVTAVLE